MPSQLRAHAGGESTLAILIRQGAVADLKLELLEPSRTLSGQLRGRSCSEAPQTCARVCGLCPVASRLGSIHAIEGLRNIRVTGALRELVSSVEQSGGSQSNLCVGRRPSHSRASTGTTSSSRSRIRTSTRCTTASQYRVSGSRRRPRSRAALRVRGGAPHRGELRATRAAGAGEQRPRGQRLWLDGEPSRALHTALPNRQRGGGADPTPQRAEPTHHRERSLANAPGHRRAPASSAYSKVRAGRPELRATRAPLSATLSWSRAS